jgi:peptide/nickel transport system permease protein
VLRYIIRRLLWLVFVLLLIGMITYVVFFVMPPTNPAVNFCGRRPSHQCIEEVSKQFGINKPFYEQYALYVRHVFFGDQYGWPGLGVSFKTRTALRPIIADRIWITIQLALGAAAFWLLLGIPIGILSAIRPRSVFDRGAMGFALIAVSAPVFWLGLIFLYVFWYQLHWAGGTGYVGFSQGLGPWFEHMILPWIVLALLYAAFYARMLRGDLMETMSEDYIRTARAKGLSERRVIYRHGVRAAMTPVMTLFGANFGALLGGAIITETVFNLQGLGSLTVQATRAGDLYALADITILGAFFVATANLVVDILYAFMDPRVRYV